MVSTSFEMVSSSMMDEKSLPNPPPSSPVVAMGSPIKLVGVVDHAVDVLEADVAMATDVAIATPGALQAGDAQLEAAELCVGVLLGGVVCFRSAGGIMAGVSSVGTSFPRTFSAIKNMASAN